MEFAQFVEQLPDEALDDLVLQFQMEAVQQEEGRMPGNFDDGGINIEIGEELDGIEVHGQGVREIEQGRNGENEDEDEEDEDEDEDEDDSPVSGSLSLRIRILMCLIDADTWIEEHHWSILGKKCQIR